MYRIVEIKDEPIRKIAIEAIRENHLTNAIIMAEKEHVQDILIFDGFQYQWSSVYVRHVRRSKYDTIIDAVISRLQRGMSVYVFQNRGELKAFLKHNGIR